MQKYRVYWASQPAPENPSRVQLDRLVPVDFSTETDALHAAILLLRAKQYVWCIERPDAPAMNAREVAEKVAPAIAQLASNLPLGRKA